MFKNVVFFFRSMLEAVWRPWGLNCTCLVVTTIRLSCPMSWKPTTRSPAPGVLLDDYLSRPSGMAASAFSGSSCPSCRAHSNPLTYPSQTAFSCTGITDTTRSTISITSTRTRIRMWTRHTDLETPIDHVLPHRALSVLWIYLITLLKLSISEKKTELVLVCWLDRKAWSQMDRRTQIFYLSHRGESLSYISNAKKNIHKLLQIRVKQCLHTTDMHTCYFLKSPDCFVHNPNFQVVSPHSPPFEIICILILVATQLSLNLFVSIRKHYTQLWIYSTYTIMNLPIKHHCSIGQI